MNDELRNARMRMKMTQEELAEKLDVSRQTVAKWENGESVPDIMRCTQLAEVFEVEIDDIASMFIPQKTKGYPGPKGKYIFGKCVIRRGLIVLPDDAIQIFNLKDGDELLLVGDIKQGMALVPVSGVNDFVTQFDNAPVLEVKDNE
ncbi:MAG: helix-turn-helix transcriptional regulator [Clostridia bacterium]|nr:helix-turn-helix transcriptional regulator [Clostridia bacterium]